MNAKVVVLIAMLASMVLSTGCWNRRELTELATVMAMGVDKVPDKKEYRVSFQIVNSGAVTTGTSGGGASIATPVTVYASTGSTLFEAIRKTSQLSPRRMFFAHVREVVIGEALAREGIQELFDLLERSHETRLTSRVVVARGSTAESIISTLTPLEKIPANAIIGKLKFTQSVWSENVRTEIDDVIRALVSDGIEPTMNGIRIVGDPAAGKRKSNVEHTKLPAAIQVSGIALFKDGKFQRWMDNNDARGVVWIKNKIKGTIINLDCNEAKEAIAIEATGAKTIVKAQMKNGSPTFHIIIRQEGNVGEVNCSMDISNFEDIKKLEKKWSEQTHKEVMSAVQIAQSEKSDIFGLGEVLNRKDKKAWEKVKTNWNHTFAKSQVDVKVESFLRRPGMRMKPYLSEVEKNRREE